MQGAGRLNACSKTQNLQAIAPLNEKRKSMFFTGRGRAKCDTGGKEHAF
jgi:hypothetical protein